MSSPHLHQVFVYDPGSDHLCSYMVGTALLHLKRLPLLEYDIPYYKGPIGITVHWQ